MRWPHPDLEHVAIYLLLLLVIFGWSVMVSLDRSHAARLQKLEALSKRLRELEQRSQH